MAGLSESEFLRRVRSGEDSFTEFKRGEVSPDDLAKELCAFLNADGGSVLIGVDDDGGLSGAAAWNEERVMNVARASIDPPPIPSFQRVVLPPDEVEVMIVSVERGAEKPYARRSGESRRYYIRVGTTSREASREELIRLTQASGAVAGDARPVPGTSFTDLDEGVVESFARDRSIDDFATLDRSERDAILRSAEIIASDRSELTVYGVLLFAAKPQQHLPSAYTDLQAYAGSDVESQLTDRGRAEGRLDQQIAAAVEFVERNVARSSDVVGIRRVDDRRPPTETIRELIANAVCHRLYGIPGPIIVRVFADRIEVTNPGSLPNGVTPAGMRIGAVSVRRNQLVVHRLAELKLVDANGRGVLLMIRSAKQNGLADPVIEPGDAWTRVTVPLIAPASRSNR